MVPAHAVLPNELWFLQGFGLNCLIQPFLIIAFFYCHSISMWLLLSLLLNLSIRDFLRFCL